MNKNIDEPERINIVWPELETEVTGLLVQKLFGLEDNDFRSIITSKNLGIYPIKKPYYSGLLFSHNMIQKIAFVLMHREETEYLTARKTPNYKMLGQEIRHNRFLEYEKEAIEVFVKEKIETFFNVDNQSENQEES